jgi:hypothetical protein
MKLICKKCGSELMDRCEHEWKYIETTQRKPTLKEEKKYGRKTSKRN